MKQKKDMTTTIRAVLCSLPLLLCILTSALILQDAAQTRELMVPDDTLSSNLLSFVHPAAAGLLAAGYAVSAGILIFGILVCIRKNDAKCNAAAANSAGS